MENSKQWLKDNKILPKISFEKNEPRVVKLLNDKPDTITADGKEVSGMKYLVEEKGTPKTIFTTSVTLISKLAEFNPGETVRILQKGYKDGNEFKTTYEVTGIKMGDEEIPVVGEEAEEKKVVPTTEGKEIDAKETEDGEETEINVNDLPF